MKPIIKLTTGGTTGCTVAIGGYHLVGSGMFDRVLVIGWEKNSESDTTGAITTAFDPIWDRLVFAGAISGLAAEAQGYMARYGASDRDGARVSVRDRKHAMNNPHAQLRKEVTLEEVLASPMLADPIHLLDVCPRTDGACAVIMASEDVAEKICPKPDWIWGTAARHSYTYLGDADYGRLTSMREGSQEICKKAGIKEPRKELDVIELYQPYSFGGLIWIEDMGIVGPGEAPQYIWDGNTDMGGELPINPSGGRHRDQSHRRDRPHPLRGSGDAGDGQGRRAAGSRRQFRLQQRLRRLLVDRHDPARQEKTEVSDKEELPWLRKNI